MLNDYYNFNLCGNFFTHFINSGHEVEKECTISSDSEDLEPPKCWMVSAEVSPSKII